MKGVILVDIPESCNECKFCKSHTTFWGDVSESKCLITEQDNIEALIKENRASSCPIIGGKNANVHI